jgi:hypothetical protein
MSNNDIRMHLSFDSVSREMLSTLSAKLDCSMAEVVRRSVRLHYAVIHGLEYTDDDITVEVKKDDKPPVRRRR